MARTEGTPYQEFMRGFNSLCSNRHAYQVWSDFWQMCALAIMNPITKMAYQKNDRLRQVWKSREDAYLSIAKRYSKEELDVIADMLAATVMEFQRNPWQDFAGQTYMQLGISNKNAGQFFTPFSVCSLSAKITASDVKQTVEEKGWYNAYDCACGGGAMLIAACQEAEAQLRPMDWRNHVLCVANDIDITCVSMCYVQLSLLGVAAVVTQSDALMKDCVDFYEEPELVWLTPMYLSDVWSQRRFWHGLDMNMRKSESDGIRSVI